MNFLVITLAVWLIYTFALRLVKKESFAFSGAVLPLLIFSLLVTIELEVNYLRSAIAVADLRNEAGIGITAFSYCIIGDDGWSVGLFKEYFDNAFLASLFLLLVYSASLFFNPKKKKDKAGAEITSQRQSSQ